MVFDLFYKMEVEMENHELLTITEMADRLRVPIVDYTAEPGSRTATFLSSVSGSIAGLILMQFYHGLKRNTRGTA